MEVVHWRRNSVLVPLKKVGKSFVAEMARHFEAFSSASALESIALWAVSILPILLLKQPHKNRRFKTTLVA